MTRWKPNGKALVITTVLTTMWLWAGEPRNAQAASQPTAQPPAAVETDWPRRYESNGYTVLLYQPQVETWEKHARIAFRAAIAVRPVPSHTAMRYSS
jgi:hypothetical protein